MKQQRITAYTAKAAMIAALYTVLTMIATALGLSSGVIQFRISEALCILPIFMPEAIPGLFIGCLISNILSGCVIWDVIFGAVATLIGALGARALRKLPEKLKWIATLPTVLANGIIVPFVLLYAYGAEGSYAFFALTVSIGELVCASVLGSISYYYITKKNAKLYNLLKSDTPTIPDRKGGSFEFK